MTTPITTTGAGASTVPAGSLPATQSTKQAAAGGHRPPSVRPVALLGRGGKLLLMMMLAIGFVTPLMWMVSASLKTEQDIAENPMGFVPQTLEWQNYVAAFDAIRPFFMNSAMLAVVNVVGVLLVSSLAGFAFARLDFRGRDLAFSLVLATAIIPSIVLIIPQYIIFQQIGWVDTFLPLWVPRVLTPVFGTFLMRQAFLTLPKELEEAAKLDGLNVFSIYFRIMLPQVKPALAAVGVFTFVESWNDLFGPLIFINSTELQTLPMALAQFQGQFFSTTNLLMAASTITVIPVIVVYLLAQKYFVQGIATSGLK
ncbi:carbohydrate ABC transporter permease [Pseudarthrobacter sp. MDT3-28]|uniref:carbohydrate ABC transporter permease n=1 Tax=Pseudarthrobacter raffinosi TaxID=2953651 RepID=UPI00208ED47C|nr:carbohydrate ABC transporter permease [Pseudarthrobacter sp. MDT3-28]MCO4239625.1 carbohydrate ABC transporter permease [Pseudarthrobacter sp. MDT3-28]